jgi:uncharacterized small protein (DUF1192 family)
MNDYAAFCRRKAAEFAELRALEEGKSIIPKENISQQPTALTDAQVQALWKADIEAELRNYDEGLVRDIHDGFDSIVSDVDALHDRIDALEAEIAGLRADLEILRSVVKAGNVEQLVRKTNVA